MKQPRKAMGLSTRLLVVCLGLYLVIAGLATWIEVVQVSEQARRVAQAEIATLTATFTPPLEAALWSYDDAQLTILLDVLGNIPSVGRVHLTTAEGRIMVRGLPADAPQKALGPAHVVALTQEKGGRFLFLGDLTIEPSSAVVQDQVFATIARAVSRTILVVILLSVVLVFAARQMVGRPLRTLAGKISRIDPHVTNPDSLAADPGAGAELALVTEAFNRLLAELLAVNASLESKVVSRTLHLEQTIDELSNTRDRLLDSAKMAVLGQLVAGIAHDLNTPLGAAISSSSSALELLQALKPNLNTSPQTAALFSRVGEHPQWGLGHNDPKVRRTLAAEVAAAGLEPQDQVLDRLLEIGITPPLGSLGDLLGTDEGLQALEVVHRYVSLATACRVLSLASEKMAGVVDNLLHYSRKDDETSSRPSSLEGQLETLLLLFAAALRSGVKVICRFEPVPLVVCRADHIQQVWINLVSNAIQAMKGKGTLELGIRRTEAGVAVSIANDGPPISPEASARLFTPFFTTKPRGSGTGLGLSICQRIVEEHGGRIEFTTAPGRTVFTVNLPARILSSPSVS